MRGRVRHAAAVLAVAAAVVAASAGCGGKGTAASAPSGPASGNGSGAAATTAPAPAAGDGAPLLRKAVAAMHAARYMTVETKGTSDGRPTHVTAHLTAAGACAATVQDGGPAAQVIATGGSPGGFYVKAGAAYWQATSPVLVKVFAGRWAEMPQSGQGSGLEQYCDLATVLSPLDTYAASAGTSKGAVTERGGQRVVPLTQKSPQGVVTRLYVAATGTPYVLAVENSEGTVTAMSFGGFDRDPHVVAPPAAEIVRFGPGAGS